MPTDAGLDTIIPALSSILQTEARTYSTATGAVGYSEVPAAFNGVFPAILVIPSQSGGKYEPEALPYDAGGGVKQMTFKVTRNLDILFMVGPRSTTTFSYLEIEYRRWEMRMLTMLMKHITLGGIVKDINLLDYAPDSVRLTDTEAVGIRFTLEVISYADIQLVQ